MSRRELLSATVAVGAGAWLPSVGGAAAPASINERMTAISRQSMIPASSKAGDTYHLFCTGHAGDSNGLIPWRVSRDLAILRVITWSITPTTRSRTGDPCCASRRSNGLPMVGRGSLPERSAAGSHTRQVTFHAGHRAQNVTKTFGAATVIDNVSLSIRPHEFMVFLIEDFAGRRRLEVTFRNEYLRAHAEGRTLAIVPDLIAILDREAAEPITTENLKYGQRVKVIGASVRRSCAVRLSGNAGCTDLTENYYGDLDFCNPVDGPTRIFGLGPQADQRPLLDLTLLSQEVRLASPDAQRLRWIVGGFYLSTQRDLQTVANLLLPNLPGIPLIANNEENDNDAYSMFAQVDYDLTDRTTLGVSLRYDRDECEQTNAGDPARLAHWHPASRLWPLGHEVLASGQHRRARPGQHAGRPHCRRQ